MSKIYIEDKAYKGEDFTETGLPLGEYDHCTFASCNFLNADLSHCQFSDCQFTDCDISMAKVSDTAFRSVQFKNCKLLGLRFDECNPFSLSLDFEACILNFSSFFKLNLKNTRFKDCKLEEVEFAETDLTNAVFSACDLINAMFDRTKLDGADLRTAVNFSIDPEINRINKAKFSTQNIAGLLRKYNIAIE